METWKDIQGYEGRYQVSNLGRVRSFTKKSNGKLLIPIKTKKGYLTVRLYSNRVTYKQFSIHRLVACAFIDNTYSKKQVNHMNGIKSDNNLNNLEWSTNQENQEHAFELGLNKIEKGEKARNVKLTQKQVDDINSRYVYGQKGLAQSLADEYNVSKDTIRSIWYGKNWKS